MKPGARQGWRAAAEALKKEKTEGLKPGLSGRVRFLKREGQLRHATLRYFLGE